MGKEIEKIALSRGHEIVSIIDVNNQEDFESAAFKSADVAIEFTNPTAAYNNYMKAFKAGVKLVSGSTGWMAEHGEEIKEQIRTRKYKPKPVKRVEIPKDNGGVRNLGVPTVVDRFIQQAIVQILTPIYEPLFSEHSFGFRPNRCCEMAIVKALECMLSLIHI